MPPTLSLDFIAGPSDLPKGLGSEPIRFAGRCFDDRRLGIDALALGIGAL